MLRQLFMIRFSLKWSDNRVNKQFEFKYADSHWQTTELIKYSKKYSKRTQHFLYSVDAKISCFHRKKKDNCTKIRSRFFFLAKIKFKPSQRDFKTVLKHLLSKFGHCYSSLQLKCKARFSPMILSMGSFITSASFLNSKVTLLKLVQ